MRDRYLCLSAKWLALGSWGLATIGCATAPDNIGGSGGTSTSDNRPSSDQVISRPRPDGEAARNRTIDPDDETWSDGSDAGALYGMSATQFLDSRQARQKIDLDRLDSDLVAAAVFHETNRRRQAAGLPALRHSNKLDDAAMRHARSMARDRYLSHTNPDRGMREPIDRAQAAGLEPRFIAENIATAFGIRYESGERVYVLDEARDGSGETTYSYEPDGKPIPNHTYRSFARDLVSGWMNSPSHRANILHHAPTHAGHACVRGDGPPDDARQSADGAGIPLFYCAQEFYAGMD